MGSGSPAVLPSLAPALHVGAEGCLEESWGGSVLGKVEHRQELQKPEVFHSGLLWSASPTFPSGVPTVPDMLPRGPSCGQGVPEPSEPLPKCSSSHSASVSPWTSPQGFCLHLQSSHPTNCKTGFILSVIFQTSQGQSVTTCCCSQWKGRKHGGCGLVRVTVWCTLISKSFCALRMI